MIPCQEFESTKNVLVCPYHDSCNYGLNSRSWSVGLEKDENILIRRGEFLASPYRGPSNKPHKSGNLTVFWIGEGYIACH
jgi:hypothetical protein